MPRNASECLGETRVARGKPASHKEALDCGLRLPECLLGVPIGHGGTGMIEGCQGNVEDENAVGGDGRTAARGTIAQSVGDVDRPAVAHVHIGDCRGKAIDETAGGRLVGHGRAGVERAREALIELIALGIAGRGDEPSGIVHAHGVGVEWRKGALALLFDVGNDVVGRLERSAIVLRPRAQDAPAVVARRHALLGGAVEFVPIGVVLLLPVGIFLLGVVVFAASGQERHGDEDEQQGGDGVFHCVSGWMNMDDG